MSSKWDNLSKEQLYELFITKNMSKPEISSLLGIPKTSLGRMLDKFGIVKSKEDVKKMQRRVNNNRTQEIKQKVSLTLKNRWKNLSDEEKTKQMLPLNIKNASRTEEHQRKLNESLRKHYESETEEEKKERITKISIATKLAMSNMSNEKRDEITKNRVNALLKRTDDQKIKSLQKLRDTWNKKSNDEKTTIMIRQLESKIKNGHIQESVAETELRDFITDLGFDVKRIIKGCGDTRFELDIFIEKLNIAIEYNGSYYHSTNGCNKRSKTYHYNKSMQCKNMGISLIHIWEDQWVNQKELVKSILKSRLGVLTDDRIYARKCTIKEISSKEYKDFCNENHIQGYRLASVRLGLFYKDKLVQIASFNKIRNIGKQNRKEEWEWVRGCPASLNSVIGGTSKLFSYFVKNYRPNSILCYADWNLFDGSGYDKCGFTFDGFTGPDKFYITNGKSRNRINRNPYKNREYKELVKSNTLFECYGAGSKRFIWTNEK